MKEIITYNEQPLDERIAREMFEAYNEKADGKTWDGKLFPSWNEIGEKAQANWLAAAQKALIVCVDLGIAPYDNVFLKED